jgi:hypothetical protein
MVLRRRALRPPSFDQRLEMLPASGFETQLQADGRVRVRRGSNAALIRNAPDGPRIERAGMLLGDEIASLVDRGYQKFWKTLNDQCAPALADQLKQLHAFEEDLREALGLASWYNTSLGTINDLHDYDGVRELNR